MRAAVPIIDLFSGPGGLSEGFSRFGERNWGSELAAAIDPGAWSPPDDTTFRVALSIEKDPIAHQTLQLRAFFRQFRGRPTPDAYYDYLAGIGTQTQVFDAFQEEATAAKNEAWCATLGDVPNAILDERIALAVGTANQWVLIGGPPCQAYSLVGRSRNKGIDGYRADEDHRHFLYREYLRIVAKHSPPVFVMENVKGLLSSTVGGEKIFDRILDDLHAPGRAVRNADRSLRYQLIPFDMAVDHSSADPRRFVLRAETLGIPQARHRVILLGIREDVHSALRELPRLPRRELVPASGVLDGIPRVRAGVSKVPGTEDGEVWLRTIRGAPDRPWFRNINRGNTQDVADRIRRAAMDVRTPRLGRGREFIPTEVLSHYATNWYRDPRLRGFCNHEARSHMKEDLERYLFAACFAEARGHSPELGDFPVALLPAHKNARVAARDGAHFSDRFRVQVAGRPSTTVTSHISKDGHYYIHPDPTQCRALTVREAARLQTFPDNYFFCGARTDQYHQVGNAVPPLLAVQLAGVVASVLRQASADEPISRAS